VRYTLFGKTGLRVSELSLGAMTVGDDLGWLLGRPGNVVPIRP
jgi:aryl-alcohol dehydrogenase-like predicted oxidoreductase